MPAIAAVVRSTAAVEIAPDSASPSPSLVVSARSTTARHAPSLVCSPTWNFTEFVPTSITAYRGGSSSMRASQPPRHARVDAIRRVPRAVTRPQTAAGSSASMASVRVWRPSTSMSVSSPMHSSIVYRTRRLWTDTTRIVPLGLDELVEELGQRVGGPRQASGRAGEAPRTRPSTSAAVEREAGLEDRLPPFEAVAVDLAKNLDVDELGADLDVVTVLGQQVELVTLLDARRCQAGQHRVRRAERRPERPPLPARDDRRQPQHLNRSRPDSDNHRGSAGRHLLSSSDVEPEDSDKETKASAVSDAPVEVEPAERFHHAP